MALGGNDIAKGQPEVIILHLPYFFIRPVEVVVSNKEYTEDDVTDELLKRPLSFETSENGALDFPGLHNDIEAISRSFFNGLNRFFEEAEEMKNGFFNAFDFPRVFDGESSSSRSTRRGVPIEGHRQDNSSPKPTEHDPGHVDLAGLAKDV